MILKNVVKFTLLISIVVYVQNIKKSRYIIKENLSPEANEWNIPGAPSIILIN